MKTINEVATWFKENNELAKKDAQRIVILSLYTKVAFRLLDKELKCTELAFRNNSFNIGITSTDEKVKLTDQEERILKTINHVYGYENMKYLISSLAHVNNCSIANITSYLKEEILTHLDNYKFYDFNDYVLKYGDNVFFVNNDTKLTTKEKERLKIINYEDQDVFTVFRDTSNGKLVVY